MSHLSITKCCVCGLSEKKKTFATEIMKPVFILEGDSHARCLCRKPEAEAKIKPRTFLTAASTVAVLGMVFVDDFPFVFTFEKIDGPRKYANTGAIDWRTYAESSWEIHREDAKNNECSNAVYV